MSKKIFLSAFVLVAVVAMVLLGFWQLDRHSEKQQINSQIKLRTSELPVELMELGAEDQSNLEYRRVTASGTYKATDSVLVRNRSYNGNPGYWLLTPLETEEGKSIIVNRGWLPIGAEEFEETPRTEVTVEGVIQKTQTATGLQREDNPSGVLSTLGRVDLDRYQQQLDYEIQSMYIQLTLQDPKQIIDLPVALEIPEYEERQHLNYAVQWFIFAVIAAFGYLLILYRNNRRGSNRGMNSDIPIEYL
ncbi:MAG: SURF1 family protein [Actinomycetota bacterium]|nr:SURF1 family protein [Actinomycetota bacterium]